MGDFFSNINLGNVFVGCFTFGLFFSFLRFIFGFDHDADVEHDHDVDHDHDHDHDHDAATSPGFLSIKMILGYMVGFGGGGIIAYYQYEQPAGICLLAALGGMIVLGVIVFYMFKAVYSQQSASTIVRDEEFIGVSATVTTSIPGGEGHAGEVLFTVRGSKQYHSALSKNNKAIKKGTEVKIVDYIEGKIVVK
jgi:membrane protein implicated in regulation of membrane protease activity